MPTQNEQFPYCQSWVLGWQYRKQNLLKELLGYSADIVCLQEVSSTLQCGDRECDNTPWPH